MRPPDCYVCHRTLRDVPDEGATRDYFTLIYFGETSDEKMAPSRAMAKAERTGHPYNAVWFCNDHAAIARQHENRHYTEALTAIKAQLNEDGGSRAD